MNKAIWLNLGIEEFNFLELAKIIIPKCEFPILTSLNIPFISEEQRYKLWIPRFHYITAKEEKALINGTWKEDECYECDFMPYGFYFPDCTLSEANRWLEKELVAIDSIISSFFYEGNCLVFCKRILYRAVFVVLHEYGHYLTYRRLGSSRERMARFILESKKEFNLFRDQLLREGNKSEEDIKKYAMMYRECCDEKEADEYALAELEKTVNKVVEYMRKKSNTSVNMECKE